jgi:hypothetical protein
MKSIAVETLGPELRESLLRQNREQALLLTKDARPVGLLVSLPQGLRDRGVDAVVWSETPDGPMHLVVQVMPTGGDGVDGKPVFGSGRGMISVNAEDDDHVADFAEYMK